MRRAIRNTCFVGWLCLLALPRFAYAASYEVVPTITVPSTATNSFYYWAMVYDNTSGMTYSCTVQYHNAPANVPMLPLCYDVTKSFKSILPPSGDLVTAVQPRADQFSAPAIGIWQINSKTGDLQFCLTREGGINLPSNGCIRVTWKGTPPG
jgi:hypothetical protein